MSLACVVEGSHPVNLNSAEDDLVPLVHQGGVRRCSKKLRASETNVANQVGASSAKKFLDYSSLKRFAKRFRYQSDRPVA